GVALDELLKDTAGHTAELRRLVHRIGPGQRLTHYADSPLFAVHACLAAVVALRVSTDSRPASSATVPHSRNAAWNSFRHLAEQNSLPGLGGKGVAHHLQVIGEPQQYVGVAARIRRAPAGQVLAA